MGEERGKKKSKPLGTVTIFGAGVTGLTVAHELIVRGFDVNVIEKHSRHDQRSDCVVGGMAATQYAYDFQNGPPDEMTQLRAPGLDLSGRFFFDPFCSDKSTDSEKIDELKKRIEGWTKRVKEWTKDDERPRLHVQIHGYAAANESRLAYDRAVTIAKELGLVSSDGHPVEGVEGIEYFAHSCRDVKIGQKGERVEDEYWRCVELQYPAPVPGEHGYRYFPGYYRNLFDTMRRTPIYDEHGVETSNTVFDNLVPTTRTAYSDPGSRLTVLERRRLRSIDELRSQLEMMLGEMHFSWQDILRIQLKTLRYLTSCSKRRVGYEAISWWDFIEGHKFSTEAQEHMLNTPQALVAMSAKHSDARVQGNTLMQLLMGQWSEDGKADMSLNGPTSKVWLGHWRRFLEYQGVRFFRGELEFFAEDAETVIPVLTSKDQKVLDCERQEYVTLLKLGNQGYGLAKAPKDGTETVVFGDKSKRFYVLATDVQTAQRVVRCLAPGGARPEGGGEAASSVEMLQAYRLNRSDQLPKITDRLRVFAGIQYYFDRRLDFFDGHIFYRKSPWGLSSISQTQFWRRRRVRDHDRYLTVLSVIIGRFDVEGLNGKIAWDCTRSDIALEVWHQIEQSLASNTKLPAPVSYHIDDNLIFNRFDRFSFRVRQLQEGSNGEAQYADSNVAHVTVTSRPGDSTPKIEMQGRHYIGSVNRKMKLDVEVGMVDIKVEPMHGRIIHRDSEACWYYPDADFEGFDFFESKENGICTIEVTDCNRPVISDLALVAYRWHHDEGNICTDFDLQGTVECVASGEDEGSPVDRSFVPDDRRLEYQIVGRPVHGYFGRSMESVPDSKGTYIGPTTHANRIGCTLTPFHTNPVDDWKHRPGWLPEQHEQETQSAWPPDVSHRHNLYKNLVLAGTYMKTYTRLTTMEAANESARHAVNTILAELGIRNNNTQVAEPCKTWNPEDHEIDDLAPLKLLDEALFDAGLPHFADILELDKLPDLIIEREHDDLSLRPNLEQLSRLLKHRPGWSEHLSSLSKLLGRSDPLEIWEKLASMATNPTGLLAELSKQALDPNAFAKMTTELLDWLRKLGQTGTSE